MVWAPSSGVQLHSVPLRLNLCIRRVMNRTATYNRVWKSCPLRCLKHPLKKLDTLDVCCNYKDESIYLKIKNVRKSLKACSCLKQRGKKKQNTCAVFRVHQHQLYITLRLRPEHTRPTCGLVFLKVSVPCITSLIIFSLKLLYSSSVSSLSSSWWLQTGHCPLRIVKKQDKNK